MIFTCTQALRNRSMHEAGLGNRWHEHILDMGFLHSRIFNAWLPTFGLEALK